FGSFSMKHGKLGARIVPHGMSLLTAPNFMTKSSLISTAALQGSTPNSAVTVQNTNEKIRNLEPPPFSFSTDVLYDLNPLMLQWSPSRRHSPDSRSIGRDLPSHQGGVQGNSNAATPVCSQI